MQMVTVNWSLNLCTYVYRYVCVCVSIYLSICLSLCLPTCPPVLLLNLISFSLCVHTRVHACRICVHVCVSHEKLHVLFSYFISEPPLFVSVSVLKVEERDGGTLKQGLIAYCLWASRCTCLASEEILWVKNLYLGDTSNVLHRW